MVGWEKIKLDEICDSVQYGYTESAQKEKVGPKFLRITDIVGDFISWDTVPYCSISKKDLTKYKLTRGDIVVARTGNTTGYAKLIRNDVESVFASYLIRFKVDQSKADSGFIGRLLESEIFKSYVWSIIGGSAQPGANAKLLGGFPINLPPLHTQRKIASILSVYDDLIENNLKRIKLLEEKAQLTYEEWFVRMKFPGHETTPINQETGLPEGWERKNLVDCCDLTMGQSPKSEFYNDQGNGLPFHQGVKDYGFRFPENSSWSTAGNRIAHTNSILFSVRAPVGRLNVAIEKIILGRGLAAINHKKGWNNFLLYQLQKIFFEDNLMGGGAIFSSVTKKDVERIKLIHATNELTGHFNEIAFHVDEAIKVLTKQNKNLKEARDILLPRLMIGMIDVDHIQLENLQPTNA